METRTGIKRRDEIAVSVRDMVFVACGTVLIITGHLYFAIAAFLCAAFRFEIGNAVVFAKAIRAHASVVRESITGRIISTALKKGLLTEEEVAKYIKDLKICGDTAKENHGTEDQGIPEA